MNVYPFLFSKLAPFFLWRIFCMATKIRSTIQKTYCKQKSEKNTETFKWYGKYLESISLNKLTILHLSTSLSAIIPFFFFYLGSLPRKFTNHRTLGKGGGYFSDSSLPLPSTSQKIKHRVGDYCREFTSAPLHIASGRTRTAHSGRTRTDKLWILSGVQ